jgi:rubredoxin
MSFENFTPDEVAPDERVECGVCWRVYDPAEGDPVWQIPPGTPFAALPEEWRCPTCDAPRNRFMRIGHGR